MQQVPSQAAYSQQQNHIRQMNNMPHQFTQQHPQQQIHQTRRISPPVSQQYSNARSGIAVYGNNNIGSTSNTSQSTRSQGPSPLYTQQGVHINRNVGVSVGGPHHQQQPQMIYRGMSQQQVQNTTLNTRQAPSQQTHYAYINSNDSNPQSNKFLTKKNLFMC